MPDPCPGRPPPCIPPCRPPPPPGGDGCLRMKWTCGCPLVPFAGPSGSEAWNPAPGFPQCVVDPLCSTYSCSPLEFWVDFPNGCLAGVPLFVPPTPDPITGAPYIPGCIPSCCGDAACFRYRWECECPSSDDVWVLKAVECVDNSRCVGASEWNEQTPQVYADEVIDGCTLAPPWMPAAPVPPIAPECCPGTGECEYLFTATCAAGAWVVDAGVLQGCTGSCAPTGWEPAGGCVRTQTVCAGTCDLADPACPSPPAAPAAPVDAPLCCAGPECGTLFTAGCSDNAWAILSAVKTCNVCAATPWQVVGCSATQQVCGGVACASTRDCAVGVPDPFPAIPPCCIPSSGFCNCVYTATYDCDTDAWTLTTAYPGVCSESSTDEAADWAFTTGCEAETTVSAPGTCTAPPPT